ncbi:AraC family transcriptional regulator [Saccharomonospora sp. NPDC006951]
MSFNDLPPRRTATLSRLPLAGHELFHSHDVDETRALMTKVLCEHQLLLTGPDRKINARMHSRPLAMSVLNYVQYGNDVIVDPGLTKSFLVAQAHLDGRGIVRCGRQEMLSNPGHLAVTTPTDHLHMRLSAASKLIVFRIEWATIETMLADLIGCEPVKPLRFDLDMDTTKGEAKKWFTSLLYLLKEVGREGGLLAHPNIALPMERQLIGSLLLAQHNTYSALLSEEGPRVPSRTVQVAIDLIQADPRLPHDSASLAKAAGVSVRALQTAVRRDLDTTPMKYLQGVRLLRVRADLVAATRDSTTVAAVARHWGFGHLGRFAGDYQRRFGESPSHTLWH